MLLFSLCFCLPQSQCLLHKSLEKGVGAVGARLEFRMELAADKPGVVSKLHHFDQLTIW